MIELAVVHCPHRCSQTRGNGSPREKAVNYSLRGVEVEPRTSKWRERPSQSPLARAGTRGSTEGGFSARRDRPCAIELLAVRYPVIRRLVGEQSFRVAARRFILSHPLGGMLPNGSAEEFPHFIRSLGNAACIEYVADVAELEMLQHKARYAPHVRPLTALALSSLQADRLGGLRVVLHPSVYLMQSRFPIVTAWENNQAKNGNGMIERWAAEAAIVARPFFEVEVRRLPPGDYAFLCALSEGKTVATAIGIATEVVPKFDVVSSLRLIDDLKVIVGIQEAQ